MNSNTCLIINFNSIKIKFYLKKIHSAIKVFTPKEQIKFKKKNRL